MVDFDGRYRLVPQAVFAPGVDLITKSATGPLVDTGVTIDLDPFVSYDLKDPRGRDQVQRILHVYLHPDTIRELAQVAGVLDVQPEGAAIREADAYNRGYLAAVKEQLGEHLVDLADRLGVLLPLLAAADGSSLVPDEEPAAGADETDEPSPSVGGSSRRARSSV